MKLLILGGTLFLGRHLTEAARARGHEVTLFNRGQTNASLFPDIETLRGDREQSLGPLRGRQWDAVIDTCGYVPRIVGNAARFLSQSVEHYTFISSASVYRNLQQPGINETALLHKPPAEDNEDVATHYGGLKAACERVVEEHFPDRALSLRCGLLVGPHDPSGRFIYWPRRVAQGGEVLAPGAPERPVQFIDARDCADWTIRMIEARQAGTFNVTGPARVLGMSEFLESCRKATTSDARFTWVPDDFLLVHGVAPFFEMPLWLPPSHQGMLALNIERALSCGLSFRPLADTIIDTLQWDRQSGSDRAKPPRLASGAPTDAGLSSECEQQLLQDWHAQSRTTGL
jgi:2'-hydroxyisoflavone reductase